MFDQSPEIEKTVDLPPKEFYVSKKHIESGTMDCRQRCALAKAIKEKGCKKVTVSNFISEFVYKGKEYCLYHSPSTIEHISTVDTLGGKTQPFIATGRLEKTSD